MMQFQWVNNTPETDRDISQILLTEFDKYSESSYYGTPVCRGAIIRLHGNLVNVARHLSQAPLINEFFRLFFKQTDAPKKNIHLFNNLENKTIEQMMVSMQPLNLSDDVEGRLITAQSRDTRRLFFPVSGNVSRKGEGGGYVTDMVHLTCINHAVLRSWVENVGSSETDAVFIRNVDSSIRRSISQRLSTINIVGIETVVDGNAWHTTVHYTYTGDRRIMNASVVSNRI